MTLNFKRVKYIKISYNMAEWENLFFSENNEKVYLLKKLKESYCHFRHSFNCDIFIISKTSNPIEDSGHKWNSFIYGRRKKKYIQDSCYRSLYNIKKFCNSQPQIQQHRQHQHSIHLVLWHNNRDTNFKFGIRTLYMTDPFHQIN